MYTPRDALGQCGVGRHGVRAGLPRTLVGYPFAEHAHAEAVHVSPQQDHMAHSGASDECNDKRRSAPMVERI